MSSSRDNIQEPMTYVAGVVGTHFINHIITDLDTKNGCWYSLLQF